MSIKPLLECQELSGRLEDSNWRVIDCRFDLSDSTAGRRDFEAAHIPGAVFMDLNEDLAAKPEAGTGRHPLPDVALIEGKIGRLGVDRSTTVVVYDGGNGAMAARAWWIFRWLGHENVKLLNGGWAAWAALGHPVSSDPVVVSPTKFVAKLRDEMVVTTDEISSSMEQIPAMNLLDARDARRFAGEHEPIDKVAGHVPGARNLPFPESLNDDGSWKSAAELAALWSRQLGNNKQTQWVAMCGSGVTACHLALSAVEAGYREPRLYIGSWSEWIADSGRPIGLGEG